MFNHILLRYNFLKIISSYDLLNFPFSYFLKSLSVKTCSMAEAIVSSDTLPSSHRDSRFHTALSRGKC